MEHLHHFGLADDPFRNEPLARLTFDAPSHTQAWQRLDRAVRQRKGLCVLTGSAGAGKTMIARRLHEGLEEEVFEASMIVLLRGAADADSLFQRYARELGVDEPAGDRSGLLAQIYERLAIVREDGRHAVLIVDDAQDLGSVEELAAVASLLRLEYEERRLLSIVLVGALPLDRALRQDPVLRYAADLRVELAGLDAQTANAYLVHRIEVAKGDSGLFEQDALAAIHACAGGLPGRMNTLADNALFEAFLVARTRVARDDVDRAHGHLGWSRDDSAAPAANGADRTAASERSARHAGAVPGDDLDAELDAVFVPDGDEDAVVAELIED